MKIGRVFIKRTSYTPDDPLAFIGAPDLFTPRDFDEIHISCIFSWDKIRAEVLRDSWLSYSKKVIVGGPAFDDRGAEFVPGRYIKKGITITSRGCVFKCSWCSVPGREGKIRALKTIHPGNIVQDNNLLACNKGHIQKVFQMLRTQKRIKFYGGLDTKLIKDWHINELRSLSIDELWFAADSPAGFIYLKACNAKLTPYFSRDQLRCYVLIGYEGDTVSDAEQRCREVYDLGFLPFAQRYRTLSVNYNNSPFYQEKEWQLLARKWMRPALYRTRSPILTNEH